MDDSYNLDNIRRFYESLPMPGGYDFSHTETLKYVDLYYNSKFEKGPKDSRGFIKLFYQIIKPACDIATKFVDLDTKDIILYPEGDNEFAVWVMQRELKQWLKEQQFGILLNEIAHNYPKYGHVVLKKSKSGWKNVVIGNLRMYPGADTLEDSPFVYEVVMMTAQQIKDMGWDAGAISTLLTKNEGEYLVYECYDYNLDAGPKWKRTFKANLLRDMQGRETAENQINDKTKYAPSLVLNEDYVEKLPYRELRWEKVPGRWLGFGFAEYLIPNQQSRNELVNIKRKGLYWTALKIYQTRDEGVGRNLMTDAENGDIIKAGAEITPIANEERNLAVFNQEEQSWDMNSEKKTFTFDISRGGNLPSQTPLGVANLSAGMVSSYFDPKRENFGMFVKELLFEDVIPDFKNKKGAEHVFTFMGSDPEIDKLDQLLAEAEVFQAAYDYAASTGYFPTAETMFAQRDKITRSLKASKNRSLKLPDGLYNDARYFMDILLANESVDLAARQQAMQFFVQIVGTNPTVLQNPGTRAAIFKMMEMSGVSPIDLNIMNQQLSENPPQMPMAPAGSLAKPMPAQAGAMAQGRTGL